MSRAEDRFRELCAAWALGALDGEELAEFRELLEGATPEMLRAYAEMEEAALCLSLAAGPAEPAAEVKAKLLATIRASTPVPPADTATQLAGWLGLHRPRFALAVTLALLLLVAGLGYLSTALYRAWTREQQRVVALTSELERKEALLQILRARDVQMIALEGPGRDPVGHGRIIWDVGNRVAVLHVANLPPTPENKIYQLWIYAKDRAPASPGVFAVKATEREAFFRFEGITPVEPDSLRGFLITLEAEGGASQPSREWYLGSRVENKR